MDRSETLARDHLLFRGFSNPKYEPDGNVPPDFLLDGRIAVEVRRLNENERGLSSPKGLEQTKIPMLMGLQELCDSFGAPSPNGWWLALRYRRPLPGWKILGPVARKFLEELKDGILTGRHNRHLDENVEIEAIPRVGAGEAMFHVAIVSDGDSGGWVLEEVERNLRLCIDEKTKKIQAVRNRYPEWWLLFVDQVAYGLSEYDRAQFKSQVQVAHSWDKIILVNPLDHTHFVDL